MFKDALETFNEDTRRLKYVGTDYLEDLSRGSGVGTDALQIKRGEVARVQHFDLLDTFNYLEV